MDILKGFKWVIFLTSQIFVSTAGYLTLDPCLPSAYQSKFNVKADTYTLFPVTH